MYTTSHKRFKDMTPEEKDSVAKGWEADLKQCIDAMRTVQFRMAKRLLSIKTGDLWRNLDSNPASFRAWIWSLGLTHVEYEAVMSYFYANRKTKDTTRG